MQEVKTNVNGIDTTLLLDDEDAKRVDELGFKRKRADDNDVSTKARKSTENKSA